MTERQPLTSALAASLATVGIERATEAGVRMAMLAIIDTVGVTLAGSVEPAVTILRKTLVNHASVGPALIFGDRRRIGILEAALVNGTASHAIDYDDMAEAMGGHPSVPVVPVVMALGESLNVSGRDLIDAYIVGFEAECRLGRVVHPHHYEKGWHPTSTLGVFGAAAAAARLLKLDQARTATALALCASLASGVKANFGTMTKPLHVGHCARNGLFAALLAQDGFTANPGALEHKQGFFAAYDDLENVHLEHMIRGETEPLEIEHPNFGLKQFPCCGSTHPAILAMLALAEREHLTAREIETIDIQVDRQRLPHTDNPAPKTALGAKFSIQYAAVRALIDGAPRLNHFEGGAYLEPEVRRLLARTTASPLPEASRDMSDRFAAEVSVTTRDGRRLTGRVVGALGRGPTNPMSDSEMWAKFHDCASLALPDASVSQAYEALNRLDRLDGVSSLTRILEQVSPAPQPLETTAR
ncbi:MmgE/PrpD family protein [Lichenicoccus sp.]|uniref:MmgE/PrpD family protein n=1 Tax=Lichenicoccus sp. TaxID=2781899 RepID=UPI003D1059B5